MRARGKNGYFKLVVKIQITGLEVTLRASKTDRTMSSKLGLNKKRLKAILLECDNHGNLPEQSSSYRLVQAGHNIVKAF